jgi:hypothetical protein
MDSGPTDQADQSGLYEASLLKLQRKDDSAAGGRLSVYSYADRTGGDWCAAAAAVWVQTYQECVDLFDEYWSLVDT